MQSFSTKIRNQKLVFELVFIKQALSMGGRFYLISAIGIITIFMGLFNSVQKKIIFRPTSLAKEHVFEFEMPYEEFYMEHSNGERINALHFPTTEQKGIILYFHGNSRNLQHWGKYLPDLVHKGYAVIAIDYRGYGKSDGNASEQNLYEDGMLAYQYVKDHFETKNIIIWGRSLGSAVASRISTEVQADKLVLETPFYSMPELVNTRFPYLIIPVNEQFKFPNNEHLTKTSLPTYIIQGTKDNIVPYRSAEKLKSILEKDENFFTIKGAGHKNLHEFVDYHYVLDEIL